MVISDVLETADATRCYGDRLPSFIYIIVRHDAESRNCALIFLGKSSRLLFDIRLIFI